MKAEDAEGEAAEEEWGEEEKKEEEEWEEEVEAEATKDPSSAQGARPSAHHPLSHPKVIITTRTELLSGKEGYLRSFLPLEHENDQKDEEHEALSFFLELRLAPFNDKLDAYIHALVALQVRDQLTEKLGVLQPLPKDNESGNGLDSKDQDISQENLQVILSSS